MKRYKVNFDEGKTKGVFAMSVVEHPAMESSFIALKETPLHFAEVDPKRNILLGAALIPDKPIYRNDDNGEYELIFDSHTIEKAAHNFVKAGYVNNATEEHSITLSGESVSVVESWIKEDNTHDKSMKFGLNEPIGTWFIMMKVNDDEIYNKAKQGKLKGFSIEGLFNTELILKSNIKMSENKEKEQSILDKIEALFTSKKPEEKEVVKLEEDMPKEESKPDAMAEISAKLDQILDALKPKEEAPVEMKKEESTKEEETKVDFSKEFESLKKEILELKEQPASKPARSKPQNVDLSKMTSKERILFKLQNVN